ncbi:MAG: peptidylprolyl isomerase [Gammaproteobacteria bacterium SG8_47]|nr:MAG: peptidylprolyl isomerase [Gammaproteobacteria bacterium SG8_47]
MTDSSTEIVHGSTVLMHFTLSIEDGTVADTSRDDEPLSFTMGDGTLIEGLELMLYGLKAGDKQCLRMGPRDAFGYPDEDNVHRMARREFGPELSIEPGTIIGFETPGGDEVPGVIKAVEGDEVVVDFNHPLAGHEVTFEVEILDVTPPASRAD